MTDQCSAPSYFQWPRPGEGTDFFQEDANRGPDQQRVLSPGVSSSGRGGPAQPGQHICRRPGRGHHSPRGPSQRSECCGYCANSAVKVYF
eukprot:9467235-Pyramimonas_sp.AAC.2